MQLLASLIGRVKLWSLERRVRRSDELVGKRLQRTGGSGLDVLDIIKIESHWITGRVDQMHYRIG